MSTRANTILRRSSDGLTWSDGSEIPLTGIWRTWLMPCRLEESVGEHPHAGNQFDCLTGSSAEVVAVGGQFYMLDEGVRGPQAGDAGDTQFALGLARTRQGVIDGPWETSPHNPNLLDLPGNVGVGHADLVVIDGVTYLYTSLDGKQRSRLILVWN